MATLALAWVLALRSRAANSHDAGRDDLPAPDAQETSQFRPAAIVLPGCHVNSAPSRRTPAGGSPGQAALPPRQVARHA